MGVNCSMTRDSATLPGNSCAGIRALRHRKGKEHMKGVWFPLQRNSTGSIGDSVIYFLPSWVRLAGTPYVHVAVVKNTKNAVLGRKKGSIQ